LTEPRLIDYLRVIVGRRSRRWAAQQRSPWHRRRLAGIDPDRLDETSLSELPVMTKDELMGNFDEVVTDERLRLGEFGIQARLVKPPARQGEEPSESVPGHPIVYTPPEQTSRRARRQPAAR
jgi:hypothetical protein